MCCAMTARANTDRAISTTVYQSEVGYGKRWYVGVDIQIRHESSVNRFSNGVPAGRSLARNRDLTEDQCEGSGSLSSCVESVVENKRELKSKRSCRNCLPFQLDEPSLAALSLMFPRLPPSNKNSFISLQPTKHTTYSISNL